MRRVLNTEVGGKRVRGLPRRSWMECINEDITEYKIYIYAMKIYIAEILN
jgi:hypothetical protein